MPGSKEGAEGKNEKLEMFPLFLISLPWCHSPVLNPEPQISRFQGFWRRGKKIWTCNISFGGSKNKKAFKTYLPSTSNWKTPFQPSKSYGACFFQCLTDEMGYFPLFTWIDLTGPRRHLHLVWCFLLSSFLKMILPFQHYLDYKKVVPWLLSIFSQSSSWNALSDRIWQ